MARNIVITAKGEEILRRIDAGLYKPLTTREARQRAGRRQAHLNNLKRKARK